MHSIPFANEAHTHQLRGLWTQRAPTYTRGGTRTRNLLLRGEAPYPLGHTSNRYIFEGQICLFVDELS